VERSEIASTLQTQEAETSDVVSVSRRSRDSLKRRRRSRLGQTGKRLDLGLCLGMKGRGLGIGLRQLGLVHIPG